MTTQPRPCHGMWLFHLHSAVNIQPFSSIFPLAESIAKALCWLSLWSFREKHGFVIVYGCFCNILKIETII